MKSKQDKNFFKRVLDEGRYALKSVLIWFQRAFWGKKRLPNMEKIESPARLLRENFSRKKAAVFSLWFLVALFLFVFIAPLFVRLDMNYTDPLQQNVAPVYSLRRVPRGLKKQIAEIDGFSDFTVGRSMDGEVFVWGNTKDRLNGRDMSKVPKQIQDQGAVMIAAGKDHALALTKDGFLVGWGDKSCGQYGTDSVLNAVTMPTELTEQMQANEVAGLACGYQASGLVRADGRAYLWGNTNAVRNLVSLNERLTVVQTRKLVFTNSVAVALTLDGKIEVGGDGVFQSAVSSKKGDINSFNAYLVGCNAMDIAANNKCLAVLLSDGELLVTGAFENDENRLPTLAQGEHFTAIDGGTRHFVGVTNLGRVYAWGDNAYGQCDLRGEKGARVFAGALQSYAVDGDGRLTAKAGLKGYLMGTDGRGRDVFARIVHGGFVRNRNLGGVRGRVFRRLGGLALDAPDGNFLRHSISTFRNAPVANYQKLQHFGNDAHLYHYVDFRRAVVDGAGADDTRTGACGTGKRVCHRGARYRRARMENCLQTRSTQRCIGYFGEYDP